MSSRKQAGFTLVEIMIVVLIIGIILEIAIPNFLEARQQSRLTSALGNLKEIDTAKNEFAMQNGLMSGSSVSMTNLTPSYLNKWPSGPLSSSTYAINLVGASPTFNGLTAVQLTADCGPSGSGCPF